MDFATVPAAPPAWKKCRATSWPAPISANVPYFGSSRLIARALRFVIAISDDSMGSLIEHLFCVWYSSLQTACNSICRTHGESFVGALEHWNTGVLEKPSC